MRAASINFASALRSPGESAEGMYAHLDRRETRLHLFQLSQVRYSHGKKGKQGNHN